MPPIKPPSGPRSAVPMYVAAPTLRPCLAASIALSPERSPVKKVAPPAPYALYRVDLPAADPPQGSKRSLILLPQEAVATGRRKTLLVMPLIYIFSTLVNFLLINICDSCFKRILTSCGCLDVCKFCISGRTALSALLCQRSTCLIMLSRLRHRLPHRHGQGFDLRCLQQGQQ
jgi:hypothetical protein